MLSCSRTTRSRVAPLTQRILSLRTAGLRPFSYTAFACRQKVEHVAKWDKTLKDTDDPKLRTAERYVYTWEHEGATPEQLNAVQVAHREARSLSDKVASSALSTIRRVFDWVTGYRHAPPGRENEPRYMMSEHQWLLRVIFLESIAGVPGMVGGMVRHLHSLRLLRRDKAWIETLLEEAYNERMHLLTFLHLYKPGWFMRLMLLGAQGVFFNLFFVSYLVCPRVCHRFVGYLEEEAVVTYTRCLEDINAGRLEKWRTMPAPEMARQYWHMPENATMKDVILYVRADEAKHREVNHTLANLVQTQDRNPYALRIDDGHTPQPSTDCSAPKPTGWERKDIAAT